MKPTKISRDEKQIQTRNQLIEAGFHLISEQGYTAVSIRNLSKQEQVLATYLMSAVV